MTTDVHLSSNGALYGEPLFEAVSISLVSTYRNYISRDGDSVDMLERLLKLSALFFSSDRKKRVARCKIFLKSVDSCSDSVVGWGKDYNRPKSEDISLYFLANDEQRSKPWLGKGCFTDFVNYLILHEFGFPSSFLLPEVCEYFARECISLYKNMLLNPKDSLEEALKVVNLLSSTPRLI